MRALLVRHAESTGQAPEAPLSETGRQQANSLAHSLRDLNAGPLYASPYTRARQTIAPYADLTAQSVKTVDGFHERVLSPEPLIDWQDHLRRSFANSNYACPQGESMSQVRSRAAIALIQIERFSKGLPTIVTHGGLIASLLQAADPSFGFEDWRGLRNPDLFDVEIETGRVLSFTRLPLKEKA
ncbi:hypothetical protein ACMU_18835 [Actibacterium mucosum KCTC 23349]|uniref:Phosphoglycerate mutase n=1 Tax=Actibacterium mucosum KCTC 23349 TaxID=1454373 RepID=A0A037ZHJ6_9RHOB|nr:histidine phosphatase family protein [Actibacterium mucosum]KAJ54280.1 hypothetical protein ACMU_18835 [Actibacterium mucosum KCTC 23349]